VIGFSVDAEPGIASKMLAAGATSFVARGSSPQELIETIRAAHTWRNDDDDCGQAGALVRKVMDNAQRDRLAFNIVKHLTKGVSEPVLKRAFECWRNIDKGVGDPIAKGVKGG
jgi:catalase